jgi:hypothetical protein
MTAVEAITEVLTKEDAWSVPSPADLAAAAFLARYSNRTFEAYRHDLRDLLPMGRRRRARGVRRHPGPHRAVPGHPRGAGPGCLDDRPPHRREGQQAGAHSAGSPDRSDHRPRGGRALRWPDSVSNGWEPAGPSDGAPLGPLRRQAGGPRDRPPPHAAFRLHHGGSRRRCSAPRRPARRPPRGPRTTTIYDRRRANFDRHAAYVVVAFVAGGQMKAPAPQNLG